jgi:DNA-binding XRE family transcriptional regulator
MLTNERQRRLAGAQIERFEHAISNAEVAGAGPEVHPILHEAMIDGMNSQLADLKDEVRAYDDLRAGRTTGRVLRSIDELADALIEGRIAARLTQKELAKRIDVPEQQVQRYEQTRYSSASLDRIQTVADALKLTVGESIGYHVAASRAPRAKRGRVQITKGTGMAGRATGKKAASSAGKTLRSKHARKAAKTAAASDLAQVANRKTTSKRAASAAGKTLRAKGATKAAKSAAGSDLSQAAGGRKAKRK